MSWLSSLFGSGGEDPEAVRQRQAEAARQEGIRAQEASKQQMQMQLDYLNQLRADQQAKEAAIAAKDPTATRSAANRQIESTFAPGFESSYLPDTYDDDLANQIYKEQYEKGTGYLTNLKNRGVITDIGFGAGQKNLDDQGARVRTQLQGIGKTLLDQERSKLGDIVNTGRQRASTLEVGDPFDINPYSTQVQSSLGDFGSKFSDMFKAGIPGDLFDTTGLSSIAGSAQGPTNAAFDPGAVGGAGAPTEDDPFAGQKPVQKRTSTVF
jgi:hypothetical protein